jgi:hypothetical protein
MLYTRLPIKRSNIESIYSFLRGYKRNPYINHMGLYIIKRIDYGKVIHGEYISTPNFTSDHLEEELQFTAHWFYDLTGNEYVVNDTTTFDLKARRCKILHALHLPKAIRVGDVLLDEFKRELY